MPEYRLRTRLLALVSLLVLLVCGAAVATVATAVVSQRAIGTAHRLDVLARRAAVLAVLAREQYIHEAHTIILRDRSHLGHHDEWVVRLREELDALRADVGPEEAPALAAIGSSSVRLLAVFGDEILPAIDREDWDAVREAHDEANALVDHMTERADDLVAHFEQRAAAAEHEAQRVADLARAASAASGAAAVLIALVLGLRLWRAFTTPLAKLEAVAERVARGERGARVPPMAAVELSVVATSFNRMLDALERAEAELVAAERLAAVGRIAAGVAHEINNPIAVIRGYVKTMRQDTSDPALRDELGIVDEEAAACQRIADDLLTYARSPELRPETVRAEQMLEDACSRAAEGRANAPRIELSPEPALIQVDPLRIRQVIVNLVTNAFESGSDDPIAVSGRRSGDGYVIEVTDRGRGIPADDRPHVFEPFFTTRRDGTGLGLAVCYGLVTAHGGQIRVEPRESGGTRFVVDLPGVLEEASERS